MDMTALYGISRKIHNYTITSIAFITHYTVLYKIKLLF